jgi:hypothetical protein
MIQVTTKLFSINGSMVEIKPLLIGRLIFLGSAQMFLGQKSNFFLGNDQKIVIT